MRGINSCDPGGGIGLLAAVDVRNSPQRVPLFELRAFVCVRHAYVFYGFPARLCILPILSSICDFFLFFFFFLPFSRFFLVFVLCSSRWSFVDALLIFSCSADRVPDW